MKILNFSGVNDPSETVSAGSLAPLKFEYCRFLNFSANTRPYVKRRYDVNHCPMWGWLMKKTEGRKSHATVTLIGSPIQY
jgi:hypothetical protein